MTLATMDTLFSTLEDEDVDTTLLRAAWKEHNEKPHDVERADKFRTLRVDAIRQMHTNKATKQWVKAQTAWERMEDGPNIRMPRHG